MISSSCGASAIRKAALRWWCTWYRRASANRLPALIEFAQLLAGNVSGIVEGINNKIKVIKLMAYGFRDDAYFFLRIRAAFPGSS